LEEKNTFVDNDTISFVKNSTDVIDSVGTALHSRSLYNDSKTTFLDKKNIDSTNDKDLLDVEDNLSKPSYGYITVDSKPWADVYINSQKLDTTPLLEQIRFKEGIYLLSLLHPEYPEFKDSIRVIADSVIDIRINLDTLFGYLSCYVHPWGKIYLNDEFKGESPLNAKFFPGQYILTLRNPQFSDWDTLITMKQNQTLIINHKFSNN
jgi:hypothetical protein